MKDTEDKFGSPCRALRRDGAPCGKHSHLLVPIADSVQAVIDAKATGWPCMVPGMRPPATHRVGLCGVHYRQYLDAQRKGKPYKLNTGVHIVAFGSITQHEIDAAIQAQKQRDEARKGAT